MSGTGNLYDIAGKSLNENIMQRVAEFTRENLFIGIPAVVEGVQDYESKQCVDVRPLINDVYFTKNNTIIQASILRKVFVKLTEGGGFKIKVPVHKGDLCTLHWSHRDIGKFLQGQGEAVDVDISSVAELNDCWVELGFGTRNSHQNPSVDNLIVEGEATTITITPSGEVTVNTSGTSYLKSSHHTIDTDTTITGNLVVKQNTTTEGDNTTNGNTQTDGTTTSTGLLTATAGVQAPSYGGIGGAGGTMTIDSATITTDATIGGISYAGHIHTDSQGGDTSTPK
ncbi:hypothetical protein NVP1170O_050 [Vibrio phage 1.170.O._10N.261.52.C3]|nr:hypothetical protein NVP1170O_050 [Vibrio phage 1.170.O._10N.261.52.C3]